jgi:uncharacterized membrane protein
MSWLFFALLSPMAYGAANILDNYLASKLFKNIWTLTAYSLLFNCLFVFFVFFIEVPSIPPLALFPFFLLIGLIETFYLYPYYKALKADDTSIVAALFTLGKILVPALAFLLVGEALQWQHYLGFLIIILGSAALSLNGDGGKLRLNAAFGYMLICSLLLSVETVVYKYVFEQVSWSTGFFWTTIMILPVVGCLFLIPKIRKDIIADRKVFKKHAHIFVSQEFLSFIGGATFTYAIVLAPATFVEGIAALKPMIILIYALVLGRFFPKVFREHVRRKDLFKKFLLFTLSVVGVILVTLA